MKAKLFLLAGMVSMILAACTSDIFMEDMAAKRGSGLKHKLPRMRRGCRPRHPGVKILPNRKAPANSVMEPFLPELLIAFFVGRGTPGAASPARESDVYAL